MKILITGGAGFVGSNLALFLKRHLPNADICALDNLKRRGSELALARLRDAGVRFAHGDVRNAADLVDVGEFNVLLECSAEPSVQAGYASSPAYVLETNLTGTIHCLEAARRHRADIIFLSTSRVYPITGLRALPLERVGRRIDLPLDASGPGWSHHGITTDFPLRGHRSLYGATKLASELLIEEYRAIYGMRAVINRCGVISGPWQMGKVDQGVIVLWAARHVFGGTLNYTGFGGEGFQVRDVLHIDDLCDAILLQLQDISRYDGGLFNVGGGHERSVSLLELTDLCRERTGRTLPIGRVSETSDADVPYYVTDNRQFTERSGWAPRRSLEQLLDDVVVWLNDQRQQLEPLLGGFAQVSLPAVERS
jgi:CDP-paratose 2-epimerase